MTDFSVPTQDDLDWIDANWWTITEPKCECVVPDHRGKPEFWPQLQCPNPEHARQAGAQQ